MGTLGGQFDDYFFECIVDNESRKEFCLMSLLYLDFPGGILSGDLSDAKFFDRMKEADAYLVLLDGVQIFLALKGDASAKDRLSDDLGLILNPLSDGVKKPLHFVVTKWDVLESSHELGDVANLLREISYFKSVVDQRQKLGRGTRLIPVSAVGRNFAQLQPDGRAMKKIENARAVPFNVDLPISCLLFDLISEVKCNLLESGEQNFLQKLWHRIAGQRAVLLWLSRAVIEILPVAPGGGFVKSFLSKILEKPPERIQGPRDEVNRRFGTDIVKSVTAEQALSHLIEYQKYETFWMQKTYPASLLSSYSD
jgi:hypothetical protein